MVGNRSSSGDQVPEKRKGKIAERDYVASKTPSSKVIVGTVTGLEGTGRGKTKMGDRLEVGIYLEGQTKGVKTLVRENPFKWSVPSNN